jgi:hypothetical protein
MRLRCFRSVVGPANRQLLRAISAVVGYAYHLANGKGEAVAEQAAKADDLVDEAIEVGYGRSDPLVVHAKMLRLELLKVKANLERELEDFSLNCSKCGLDVHWVSGLGITPGHWSHAEPAPHGEPAV